MKFVRNLAASLLLASSCIFAAPAASFGQVTITGAPGGNVVPYNNSGNQTGANVGEASANGSQFGNNGNNVYQNPTATSTSAPVQNGGGAKVNVGPQTANGGGGGTGTGGSAGGGNADVNFTTPQFQFGLGNNAQVREVTGDNGGANFGGAYFRYATCDSTINFLGFVAAARVKPCVPKELQGAVDNATTNQAVETGKAINGLTPGQFLDILTGMPEKTQKERILNFVARNFSRETLKEFEAIAKKLDSLDELKSSLRGLVSAEVATKQAQAETANAQKEKAEKNQVVKSLLTQNLGRLYQQLGNFQQAGNIAGASSTLQQIQQLQRQLSL